MKLKQLTFSVIFGLTLVIALLLGMSQKRSLAASAIYASPRKAAQSAANLPLSTIRYVATAGGYTILLKRSRSRRSESKIPSLAA
jgi:energy-converting hydrogenase Eha subunit F